MEIESVIKFISTTTTAKTQRWIILLLNSTNVLTPILHKLLKAIKREAILLKSF